VYGTLRPLYFSVKASGAGKAARNENYVRAYRKYDGKKRLILVKENTA
jgi:hypothetical protein